MSFVAGLGSAAPAAQAAGATATAASSAAPSLMGSIGSLAMDKLKGAVAGGTGGLVGMGEKGFTFGPSEIVKNFKDGNMKEAFRGIDRIDEASKQRVNQQQNWLDQMNQYGQQYRRW